MIEVKVLHDGEEIARIRYVKTDSAWWEGEEVCTYRAEIGVERLGQNDEMSMYTRVVRGHRRYGQNVLNLILRTLLDLSEQERSLAKGTGASDLARRQHGTLRALQARASRLRHH